jgi:conjugative relaxase-like TrwC/TraI family protein
MRVGRGDLAGGLGTTMVSVGKLAVGQADYYLDQAGTRVSRAASIGSGVEDYYAAGPEAAGRWLGRGRHSLGLAGPVAPSDLRGVLNGASPDGHRPLTGARTRVPGFDVTFSAPKSVSLLFGLGGAEMQSAVLAAHTAAVEDALDYFEREVAVARRGRDGVRLMRGRGLVAAAFVHRTSRAGDPQLHTHLLVANAVEDEAGRWSALDGRRVYQHARTAGFLYQARLRAELTSRLGVEWTPVRRGVADVAGFAGSTLRAFSRRRVEVEEALRQAGLSSPAAAQAAVLATRRIKDRRRSAELLRPEWLERAERLGLTPPAIEAVTGRSRTPRVTAVHLDRIIDHLLGAEGLTKHASMFTRADALREVCERVPAGADVSVARLENTVDRLLASPAVVPVLRPAGRLPSDFRYTTVELLRLEQRILQSAERPSVGLGPVATPCALVGALRARPSLAPEQMRMVERLAGSAQSVAIVVGKAGTGKTFALDAARAAWEASGMPVIGAAVANRAALELADGAGIPSTSLASLLLSARRRGLPESVVVVLDEASMVGTRSLAELVDHVERAHGKLVLVGDDHQLPAVEAGGAFTTLAARGPVIRLVENRRQEALWERDALDLLRHGDVDVALAAYTARGRVTAGKDAESTRAALVRDWWRSGGPDGGVMIAFRRVDVADLNLRARAYMAATGRLGDMTINVDGQPFAVGDYVLLRRNDRALGVANGERGVVVRADPASGRVTLEIGGREVVLGARYLGSSGGRSIRHGYAITGHASQGMTAQRAYVLGSEDAYREWGYVAMSRGRQLNRFYVVGRGSIERDEFAPAEQESEPLVRLRAALARSRAERLASDERSRTLE